MNTPARAMELTCGLFHATLSHMISPHPRSGGAILLISRGGA